VSGEDFSPQDACGCCDGVSVQAPGALYSRPGLSAVAYRIGTHSEVLASLKARLSSRRYPALAKLRTRDADDFSIALLDAYACMADVLSFYQERVINEAFLRTAVERRSLRELARLIGYRLKPGVAAETYLAFTLQEPPAQPAGSEPKQASGVPDKVTLDAGIKVQSVPGPGEKPQTFETVEAIEARPAWNALRPRLSKTHLPASGRTDVYLQGASLNLRPGDGLLFIGHEYLSGTDKTRYQFRRISTVTPDNDARRTRVTWDQALTASTPTQSPEVHVLRKRAAVFGHNAPDWAVMPLSVKKAYKSGVIDDDPKTWGTEWPDFKISPIANAVDLDAAYPEVVAGDDAGGDKWLVLTTGSSTAPFKVTGVNEVSRAAFAMAGKATRAALSGDNWSSYESKVRETSVFAASERLEFAEAPDIAAVSDDQVVLGVQLSGLPARRKLIVAGQVENAGDEAVEAATLKSVTPEGNVSRLAFEHNLAHSYRRETVVIYANVVLATHGETVQQILGSGAAAQSHQRFTLKHAPLTFVGADNETGAESALEVRINDILWHEAPTLYESGPNDRDYVLRIDEDGAGTIQFGDGRRGARLPTARDNVRATYRKGIGAAGNVGAGRLSQLLTRPLGLKSASNPLPASGGVDADSAENARRNMPLGVRTLGRVVSVQDYEDYARAYTGIAKAQARVLNTRAGRTVFITVAGDGGVQPPAAALAKLLDALRKNGDPLVHCELGAYEKEKATFRIALRIKRDPDHAREKVKSDVEAALRAAFSFDARDFGQITARSEIIAVAHGVEGVLGVDLDRFYRGATVSLEKRLVPAGATVDAEGNTVPAELLLLNPAPFDYFEEMA
jgi:predicted phage baseplate assembly protein